MVKTLFISLALGISAIATAQVEQPSQLPVLEPQMFSGKVVQIHDGDTITVLVGREQVRIRLHGIDAPEYKQPFGTRARQELGKLVHEKAVRLEKVDTDRYGRSVCRVYVRKLDINAEMVKRGFAWHFKRYSDDPELAEAEEEAREDKRGLWVEPNPVAPWKWRKTHASR